IGAGTWQSPTQPGANFFGSPRGTRPPIAVLKHSLRTGRKLPIRYVRGIPSSAYMSITAVSVEVDWMEIRGGVAAQEKWLQGSASRHLGIPPRLREHLPEGH